MICSNCKSTIPDDSKFCLKCGTKVVKTNACPNCGSTNLPKDSKFCPDCGTPIASCVNNIIQDSQNNNRTIRIRPSLLWYDLGSYGPLSEPQKWGWLTRYSMRDFYRVSGIGLDALYSNKMGIKVNSHVVACMDASPFDTFLVFFDDNAKIRRVDFEIFKEKNSNGICERRAGLSFHLEQEFYDKTVKSGWFSTKTIKVPTGRTYIKVDCQEFYSDNYGDHPNNIDKEVWKQRYFDCFVYLYESFHFKEDLNRLLGVDLLELFNLAK